MGSHDGNRGEACPQATFKKAEEVIDDEHIEQDDGEPVAALRHALQVLHHGGVERAAQHGHGKEEEDDGGHRLHAHLLGQQRPQRGEVPHQAGLVGQEAADEEEQRHAEHDEELHG